MFVETVGWCKTACRNTTFSYPSLEVNDLFWPSCWEDDCYKSFILLFGPSLVWMNTSRVVFFFNNETTELFCWSIRTIDVRIFVDIFYWCSFLFFFTMFEHIHLLALKWFYFLHCKHAVVNYLSQGTKTLTNKLL